MASGLFALFDDVAAIAKVAAASVDDVAAAAGKASAKAAGIVIDDTAVTPRYVTGFAADRELPIIWKIALGSLRNKLLFLLPGCIALSAFAPWALTPLLMIGGAYLCYEGAEKIIEVVIGHDVDGADDEEFDDPCHMEAAKVSGAIRTDFILSAEIMAIALADVAARSLVEQAAVLAVVGILVTVGVYGVVGMIVKMDDVGLHLVKEGRLGVTRSIGRGLVSGMPGLLTALGVIGTAAMLWVGGGIIVHGLKVLGWGAPEYIIHDAAVAVGKVVPGIGGLIEWLVSAAASGVVGLVIGAVVVGVMHVVPKRGKAEI
jgi:uncharacterized protein